MLNGPFDHADRPWESVFSDEEKEIYARYRRPRRAAFSVDAAALLVIDVTYAFLGPRLPTRQAVEQQRTACGQPGWDAVERMQPVLTRARALGWPVIFTRSAPEQHFGGATIGATEVRQDDAIVAELAPAPSELVLEKARASAFYGTPLVSYLVARGVRSIVVVGCTTSGCVRCSAIDASSNGFQVAVLHDACFDRSRLSHNVSLFELDVKYAQVMSAASVLGLAREPELARAR